MIMNNPRWNLIERPLYRWVPTIERILCAQQLPAVRGSVINIFSDYGGEHKGSWYNVTAVLYLDLYTSATWEMLRRSVRKRYLADGRRLSFKTLGDRHRQRALIPFLEAANSIVGICVVVAVHKTIIRLCADEIIFDKFNSNLNSQKVWEYEAFEKMLRVVHLVSLLIGGLSKPSQHIYWFSDEDALFANLATTEDLKAMLERFSSHYVQHPLRELGIGTTAIDEGDRFEEDHATIPDLAAGAVAEMLTRLSSYAGGKLPVNGLAIPFTDKFTPKTELMHSWLADQTKTLQRVVIVFEGIEPQGFAVFKLDMA
jgi:hypothetical protein